MPDHDLTHDPELAAIEAALIAIRPAPPRIDRDQIMFLAGQATRSSGNDSPRLWKLAAGVLALVALTEASFLMRRAEPTTVRTIVIHEPRPIDPRPSQLVTIEPPSALVDDLDLGPTAGGRVAGQVLRYGLDGLQGPPSVSWSVRASLPQSTQRSRQEELRKILEPGDAS